MRTDIDLTLDWCYICGADLVHGCEPFCEIYVCPECSTLIDQATLSGITDFEMVVVEVENALQHQHDDLHRHD